MTRNLDFSNVPRNLRCEGIDCPKHGLPTLITRSGLQHVCIVTPDCDFNVRLQGPRRDETMTKNDLEKRKTDIDNFVKAKKAAKDPSAVNVTPAKVPATKIPAELNATTGKSKKQLRRENEAKKNETPTETIKEKTDKELDENVKPKKAAKDPNMLSVSQVATELGLDPKRARAKLRGAGQAANEGRWPLVKRDSKEHKALIDLLKPSDAKPAKTKPAKEEEDEESDDAPDDEDDE